MLDLLAPFLAAVEAARLRLDKAMSPEAYNLALGDFAEAKRTLQGAQASLGITCLAA